VLSFRMKSVTIVVGSRPRAGKVERVQEVAIAEALVKKSHGGNPRKSLGGASPAVAQRTTTVLT